MPDELSHLSPRDRALYLKTLPFSRDLGSDDVMMAALHMDAREFAPGEALVSEGQPIEAMYILVDGEVALERGNQTVRTIQAPGRVGLIGLLAVDSKSGRRGGPGSIVARSRVLTFELDESLIKAMLRASFTFCLSLAGWIARQLLDEPPAHILASSCGDLPGGANSELNFVDRLKWFQQAELFRNSNLEAVAELVLHQKLVRAEAGDVLWRAGESSTEILSVVHGCIAYSDPRDEVPTSRIKRRLGGQYFHGLLEVIAGVERGQNAVADGQLLAMKLEKDILWEVLEDQMDMALEMTSVLAAAAVSTRWEQSSAYETETRGPLHASSDDEDMKQAWTRLTGIE